jgi:hypothetical protein
VSAESDERSRQPCTSKTIENVEKMYELIYQDCCQTIYQLADIGISYAVCQEILTENLNMHRTAHKFVPPTLDK